MPLAVVEVVRDLDPLLSLAQGRHPTHAVERSARSEHGGYTRLAAVTTISLIPVELALVIRVQRGALTLRCRARGCMLVGAREQEVFCLVKREPVVAAAGCEFRTGCLAVPLESVPESRT